MAALLLKDLCRSVRMKIPTPLDPETEAGLFLEITSVARRRAEKIVGKEAAQDIAQDIVLELLVRIRTGVSPIDLDRLPGLVRNMARRRAYDQLRSADRHAQPDEDYMRELTESTHAWMDPDAAMDADEVAAIRDRTLTTIPDNWRRAYTMVREEGCSYGEAATRLGISRRAVHAHLVKAQRCFRRELARQGVSTVPAPRRDRASRARRRSTVASGDSVDRPSIMTWMLMARSPPAHTPFKEGEQDADKAGQHVAVAP
jgi:RNA polymerase sigma factor (sigma-70 family)